jgi:hypothetical protein
VTAKSDQVQQAEVECLEMSRDCKKHEGSGKIRPWQQRGEPFRARAETRGIHQQPSHEMKRKGRGKLHK